MGGEKVRLIPRLVRAQFTPIMIAPVVLGAALAWHVDGAFSPSLFLLVALGAVCLHLAANAIDDVYDYVNGTDAVAEKMFPPDAPGWKPIPRGSLTLGDAFKVSYMLYGASLAIGAALSFVVGWYALAIALPGIILSYFYTAPPLRLDYRGLGLGELSILLGFGPIPALGAYYVMAGHLSALPVLVAVPTGLMTVSVLISHDQIFYDVYLQSGKRSLTVVLGRRRASILLTLLGAAAYLMVAAMVAVQIAPTLGLLALGGLPLFFKLADLRGAVRTPPEYGRRTSLAFLQSTIFTGLLAAGLVLG
ncbi:MAG: prenyltransferase [Thaumarchaeota archaeon]|nr:prenyltransferase [Nitrososphaerota archaeon]